ncbi:MAG TPA: TadE/TadG family type IV pilus assembly protein [Candidatus Binataceae bacterium]|nr:TadE/TadG family type IV pilus assembly protein [Candidatus Binataceae bacterium]
MASKRRDGVRIRTRTQSSGQAAVEFAMVVMILLSLMCGLIEFGRALNYEQEMVGLSREGSSITCRGTDVATAATALVSGGAPLDMAHYGGVILTTVQQISNSNKITAQASGGGYHCTSHVGTGVGSSATVPTNAATLLNSGMTVYITEVCYQFTPITPIGTMLNIVMPTQMYQAAYF